jgi:LysR family transcriptional repressor of citA
MNINHLQYLVDAADLGSYSLSARKNRVSQPALSQSIRTLENELGFPLLKHRPKTFELTNEGKSFLVYARQIINLVQKAKTEPLQGTEIKRPVRIVCTHSFFKFYLKKILPNLKKRCSQWEISVSFGDRKKIKQSLHEKHSDVGFMIKNDPLTGYEVNKIKTGSFYEITSNSKDFGADRSLFVTSLDDGEVKKMIQKNRFKSRKIVEIGSWEAIYELVSSQFGSGIVPEYLIENDSVSKKKLLPYELVMVEKKSKNNQFKKFTSIALEELTRSIK